MPQAPRILMVIAEDAFRDEELFIPLDYFRETLNWQVDVASTQPGEAKGMLGKSYAAEKTLDEISSDDTYQAIIVVGGMGSPTYLWQNQTLLKLVQGFYHHQKVVAAICLSGVVLANAGVLKGKQATVWQSPESLNAFETHGVNFLDHPVVEDGLLITANGPDAALAFAKKIEAVLLKVPVEQVL